MTHRHPANLIIGLALIAGLSMCGYNFATAEKRVREECELIAPGMHGDDLRTFAGEHGLTPPPKDNGTSVMTESRTYGRWGCSVELVNGVVTAPAKYHFAD